MLQVNNNITNWDKKIVYAPNGFGKTRSSEFLFDHFRKMGEKVEIFSRKNIESLVSTFDKDFFIGKEAVYEFQKAEIETLINKNKTVEGVLGFTKEKSASKLKQKSFYCAYNSISNTSNIPTVKTEIVRKYKIIKDVETVDIELLDQELNYELFISIQKFLEKFDKKELEIRKRRNVSNYEVNESIASNLQELYMYCKFNNVNQCYFCGKKYKSHQSLLEHIEKRLGELEIPNDKLNQLYELFIRVKKFIESSNSKIVTKVFPDYNSVTIKKQLAIIKIYKELCECDVSYWHNKVLSANLMVNSDMHIGTTILDLLKRLDSLNSKLLKVNKKDKEKKKTLIENVIKKIYKYIKFDEDVSIEPLKEKCGLVFKIKGKKVNPSEKLSESEIKRIALIVLEEEIKHQHIKTVILDDPIDSYDDYNKRVACQYISEILSKKSLNHWYVFTNDFECVYYLSKSIKKNTIFCLEDINKIYYLSQSNYAIECNPKEVEIIAKNDLYYLDQFVNVTQKKFPYDNNILFCALTLTLRNVKTDILNKYHDLEFKNPLTMDKTIWSIKIKEKIERCTEHFDNYLSPLVQVKEIAEPFHDLNSKSRKHIPAILMGNATSFEMFREVTAKDFFTVQNKYSDVVNYLFKKVVIINYLKYELEKKLMLEVKSKFVIADFNAVDSKRNGLSSRISTAISLDNNNGNVLKKFLRKVDKIHKDYSSLYNAVDHGTTLMISPYLSISIKDILNFKKEVDAL